MTFSRLLLLPFLLCPPILGADTINLAVASNFTPTLRLLAELFEQQSGHVLRISSASTGKLYAQITHGAPFDIFLAADAERPQQLETSGLTLADSRITYAEGKLALWSPSTEGDPTPQHLLGSLAYEHLALANPQTAPYGRAAQQTLQRLDLWENLQSRIVRGENVAQAFQFVDSGAARLGFVALPQTTQQKARGYLWQVPASYHDPIRQQAVLLKQAAGKPAAHEFFKFLQSQQARQIIIEQGYEVEDRQP